MLITKDTKRIRHLLAVISLVAVASFNTTFAQSLNFKTIKQSLRNGANISDYDNLKTNILYPYLAYEFYKKNLDYNNEIIDLVDNNHSTPVIKSLHNQWLLKKYSQQEYKLIVDNYHKNSSTSANCAYRSSQLILGNKKAAFDNIYQIWLSKKNVSSLCSPVFLAWNKSSNPAYLIKRAIFAYEAGNADFAITLATKVNSQTASTIVEFANYLKYPDIILNTNKSSLTSDKQKKYLLPTILMKLANQNSVTNADFILSFPELQSEVKYQSVLTKLAINLTKKKSYKAITVYKKIKQPSKDLDKQITKFLVQSNDLNTLSKTIKSTTLDESSLYFLAYSYEKEGKKRKAKNLYKSLAKVRSYYGFLASDKVKTKYTFNNYRIKANKNAQKSFNKSAPFKRAVALFNVGEDNMARKEIFSASRKMTVGMMQQLAYWLDKKQYYFSAVSTLAEIRDWNDINIRFPTPYNKCVNAAAKKYNIEPSWIYAIIRKESTMNKKAKSRVGALGLMQLMPKTARKVSSDYGIDLSLGVLNTCTNINLGSAYLAQMLKRFGSPALASAAYNAGPGNVNKWMNRNFIDSSATIDEVVNWVELIPFRETKKYVKVVMEYQQVYAKLLSGKVNRVSKIMLLK